MSVTGLSVTGSQSYPGAEVEPETIEVGRGKNASVPYFIQGRTDIGDDFDNQTDSAHNLMAAVKKSLRR